MRLRIDWLRLLSLVLLLAQPVAAAAQERGAISSAEAMARSTTTDADMGDAQARSHFRLGREYYQLGRFAEAANEFEVAYGLSGRAALLYNVYISYREALDTPKAAAALRGYLAAVPDAPDRPNLSARLTALEAQVAQSKADREREEAQRAEVERLRREAEVRAQAPKPVPTRARPWWPWLIAGAGAVAVVTGITLGGLASSDAADLRARCVADPRTDGASVPFTTGNACAPSVRVDSRRDAIQSQALVGDVLWIGGAAVAVTGLVLAIVLPPEEHPPLQAACGPHSCQAAFNVRF